jgi:hypothetical protein
MPKYYVELEMVRNYTAGVIVEADNMIAAREHAQEKAQARSDIFYWDPRDFDYESAYPIDAWQASDDTDVDLTVEDEDAQEEGTT